MRSGCLVKHCGRFSPTGATNGAGCDKKIEDSFIHHRRISRGRDSRRGAALVELALLSPFLLFLFVIVVDFGRIFYYSQTVQNAARAGALYMSDDVSKASSPYANVTAAAIADATNLSPAPTVTSSTGNDANGDPYVRVTVTDVHPILHVLWRARDVQCRAHGSDAKSPDLIRNILLCAFGLPREGWRPAEFALVAPVVFC